MTERSNRDIKLAIERWDQLPEVLKLQIDILSDKLKKKQRVRDEYKIWEPLAKTITIKRGVFAGEDAKKILLASCIFKNVSAMSVSRPSNISILECYNNRGEPIIKLTDILYEGSHVKLFKAKYKDDEKRQDIVVKIYERRDSKYNTQFEIDQYKKLEFPSPSINLECYLWGIPVLVMRTMNKLSPDDDENEIGIQILKQLYLLHQFTVHSDIKPQNIMREISTSKGVPVYRLIDFGGCARERMGNGFQRRTWSAKWTTQKRRRIETSPKYDLLELGHTLTAIKYTRQTKKPRYPNQYKRKFDGRLKKYMDYVNLIDDSVTPYNGYEEHYKKLIHILNRSDFTKSSSISRQRDKRDKNKHEKDHGTSY